MSKLSHLDDKGAARMVDVSDKAETAREAVAESLILLSAEGFDAVVSGTVPKGDVLAAARIAGIMAAKRVPDLIPLCHPLPITGAQMEFEPLAERNAIRIAATVKTFGKTGVEMEALTAASVAALTIYDMVKAVDKSAVIASVRLISKSGGKSGDYRSDQIKSITSPAPLATPKTANAKKQSAKPQVLMGEVAAARAPAAPHAQRDAFRTFMTSHRLRATQWAKEAGVPVGEIMAFLTGRSRGFASETADKLARAAKVRTDDMFK
jgi:cyclic pyranopterin phosphate synthase